MTFHRWTEAMPTPSCAARRDPSGLKTMPWAEVKGGFPAARTVEWPPAMENRTGGPCPRPYARVVPPLSARPAAPAAGT